MLAAACVYTLHDYRVPARPQQFSLEIKRSRFHTSLSVAGSAAEAGQFIDSVRACRRDANHHCWAYVAGAPGDLRNADKSDDGEPRGTAGMPMLNVLAHSDIGRIVVVVSRYFGGVKLGAGGLVRAYTRCVSEALLQLETQPWFDAEQLHVSLPYSLLARLEHWLENTRSVIVKKSFTENVQLVLEVPLVDAGTVLRALKEIGQGEITVSRPAARSQ